jgi:hypothetical protein
MDRQDRATITLETKPMSKPKLALVELEPKEVPAHKEVILHEGLELVEIFYPGLPRGMDAIYYCNLSGEWDCIQFDENLKPYPLTREVLRLYLIEQCRQVLTDRKKHNGSDFVLYVSCADPRPLSQG